MILPLRIRHRRTILALIIFLPIAVMTALFLRAPVPVNTTLPNLSDNGTEAPKLPTVLWRSDHLWPRLPGIRTVLRADSPARNQLGIELSMPAQDTKPDLLVYWSAQRPADEGAPGAGAFLIGQFSSPNPVICPLPDDAKTINGFLILYSLAYAQTVSIAPCPTREGATPASAAHP